MEIDKKKIDEIRKEDKVLNALLKKLPKDELEFTLHILKIYNRNLLKKEELSDLYLNWIHENKVKFVKRLSLEAINLFESFKDSDTMDIQVKDLSPRTEMLFTELTQLSLANIKYYKTKIKLEKSKYISNVIKEVMEDKEVSQEIKEKARRIRVLFGIIRYYGYLEITDFFQISSKVLNLEIKEIGSLLGSDPFFYYKYQVSSYIDTETVYFPREYLIFEEDIAADYIERKKKKLEYHILSEEEFYEYGVPMWYKETKEVKEIKEFYSEVLWGSDLYQMMNLTLSMIQFHKSLDEFLDIMQGTNIGDGEESFENLAILITNIWNTTPRFQLKGNLPKKVVRKQKKGKRKASIYFFNGEDKDLD